MDFYERQGEIYDSAVEIFDRLEREGRDATDKEIAELEDLAKKYEGSRNVTELKDVIDQYKENPYGGRVTDPNSQVDVKATGPRAKGDFKSLGEFARSVRDSGIQGRRTDPRLIKNAPTTIGTEGTGQDGGFLVPDYYSSEILKSILGEDSLLSLCDTHITPSNSFIVPADEVPPWDNENGITATWTAESGQLTQSKPDIKEKTVKLNKLTALIPVSEELMEDAPSLDAYLKKVVPQKFTSAVNLALVQGSGVGEPQGILNCPSLVSVSKESGQDADTIVQ